MGHAVYEAVFWVGILSVLLGTYPNISGRRDRNKERGGVLKWLVMGVAVRDFGPGIHVAMAGPYSHQSSTSYIPLTSAEHY